MWVGISQSLSDECIKKWIEFYSKSNWKSKLRFSASWNWESKAKIKYDFVWKITVHVALLYWRFHLCHRHFADKYFC